MSNFYEILKNNCDLIGWCLGALSILITLILFFISYYKAKKKLRQQPTARISNQIAKYFDDEKKKNCYQIKIINETSCPVHNVKGKLWLAEKVAVDQYELVNEIKFENNDIFQIGEYNHNHSNDHQFTHYFRTYDDIDTMLNKNDTVLLFDLSMTHSVSNNIKVFEKIEFDKNKIKQGTFVRGIYDEIIF